MRVVIIGAGNVATHLAIALDSVCDVVQVYSYHLDNAKTLAQLLKNAEATDKISRLKSNADLYIISVKDDVISNIVNDIEFSTGLWVHTSGSVPVDVLKQKFDKCGVFYPLQTFSKGVEVDISEVPFFIEGSTPIVCEEIKGVASLLSNKIYDADSNQRKTIHVAAVFGCNFVNHLWMHADEILKLSGFDFEILRSLIKATLSKTEMISPYDGQTGPARRGDEKTMLAHEQILEEEKLKIYRLLSESIMSSYSDKK